MRTITSGDRTTSIRCRLTHEEAASLLRMVGRNGETVDSVREVIRIDRESLKSLRGFAAIYPAESAWVREAIQFRGLILESFDQLTRRPRQAPRNPITEQQPWVTACRHRSRTPLLPVVY